MIEDSGEGQDGVLVLTVGAGEAFKTGDEVTGEHREAGLVALLLGIFEAEIVAEVVMVIVGAEAALGSLAGECSVMFFCRRYR